MERTVLAVFGATGRTGRRLLDQALAAGYTVRALARRPEALAPRAGLTVIAGDVLDADAVARTVAGSDAVISVFGPVKGSPADVQTRGTRNIVSAMRQQGVRRLITLSGGGLRDPRDEPKRVDTVIQWLLKRTAPQVLRDAEGHLEVLKQSGLDWTVVRGPRLTEAEGTGAYTVGRVDAYSGTRISRDDLAEFILMQVDDTRFLHGMPFVSA